MNYLAGYCSTTAQANHGFAPLDFPSLQHFARLVGLFDVASNAAPEAIRVVIAGDHSCLRASLKTMLELDPRIKVVGEAADDCEAMKLARKLRPDVLLVDLDMRCCDKWDTIAEIADRKLASSIVALTIHSDDEQRKAALAAGTDVLLEKGVPYRQLIRAVRLGAANSQKPEGA
jgi:DNA-binding NarL/FixJ family response regulator